MDDAIMGPSCLAKPQLYSLEERAHYHWTVELDKNINQVYPYNTVGVTSRAPPANGTKGPLPQMWGSKYHYGMKASGRVINGHWDMLYGDAHKPGDTIAIHFDNVHGTLEFSLNGKALGIIYRNVSSKLQFKPSHIMSVLEPGVKTLEETLFFKCYRTLFKMTNSHELVLEMLPEGMEYPLKQFEFYQNFSGLPFKEKSFEADLSPPSKLRKRKAKKHPFQTKNHPVLGKLVSSLKPKQKDGRFRTCRLKKACPCCGEDKWCK